MAAYLGVDHIVAVSSCTLGQTLALQAAGITGGEVIVPSFTIAATANAAYWNGSKVVLADLNPDTFNISLEHVESLINENTKAIMPVHVFGNPCQINELQALGDKYGVRVQVGHRQRSLLERQQSGAGRPGPEHLQHLIGPCRVAD